MNRQAFKVLLSLGFIIVGIIIGSFIKWERGSAALIGAIAGLLLYAFISWLFTQRKWGWWLASYERQQTDIGNQYQVDGVSKKTQDALQEEQMRHPPTYYSGGPL